MTIKEDELQKEVSELYEILEGVLFQYDAYQNLAEWDEIRRAREKLHSKKNSKQSQNLQCIDN